MKKTIFIVLAIVFIATSCSAQKEYDFSDPNVAAYLNGEPIYQNDINLYIELKERLMEEYIENDVEYDFANLENKFYGYEKYLGYKHFDTLIYDTAKEYLSFTDEQKRKDYFRSLVIIDYFENGLVEWNQQFYLDLLAKNKLDLPAKNNKYIDVVSVIVEFSKKNNMTIEEYYEKVFVYYFKSMEFYINPPESFMDKEFSGKTVELLRQDPTKWTADNEEYIEEMWVNLVDFLDYADEIYTQFQAFLDEKFEKADLVERP